MCKENGSCIDKGSICEECFEFRLHWSSVAGANAAYKECVAFLLKEAADLFVKDKEQDAALVKRLAKTLETKQKELSKEVQQCINKSRIEVV